MKHDPRFYQLTVFDTSSFAEEICDNINKDYANQAFVRQNQYGKACFVTAGYWEYCKQHVQKHRKLKGL